ncbi:MAG TPA: four helix bundle protein [Chitinophagales bacterium]|nr:four helix bundle protein [Chitinophagales bacterium]
MIKSNVTYKNLILWQHSMELVTSIYTVTKTFPESEKFKLISQFNRAVVSIPSNMAEGYGRASAKNYIQFLKISIGSVYKVETLLLISKKLNYLSSEKYIKFQNLLEEISELLNGLISSIQRKIA